MNRLISGYFLGMVLSVSALAQSPDMAPDALAKKVTEEVLAVLRTVNDIDGKEKEVRDLVTSKVLPHFNFTRMTQLALGRNWRQVNPQQQQTLTAEFRTLLVYTYTSLFTLYRDQVIEYKPLKLQPGDTEVVVRSLIKQTSGADPIDVNYSMEKTDQSWKVYDVAIAGVSLVQNYRSTFNTEAQKGGIEGLITTLTNKNKALAQRQSGKK